MAIQIPDSLYSAGNVKLDSTPSVNFYRQIEAERRAKQDAIDDYMRGLRGKVTPAGMDVNDIPAFDYMRKKWQDFGMQYRDKIARDPQVRSQFESMAADLISLAERSKAKVKAGEPVVQMLSKKENANQIRPEWLAEYDQAMKPLMKPTPDGGFEWDYDRKDIDFTKPIWKPADFDFTKRFNTWKSDLKPDVVVEFDKPTTLKQTGTVVFPKTERFNKESILQIARNAEKDISQDEDAKLYYRDRLAGTNQDEYIKLDQIHQKYFGTPIGKDENAPVRFAAAEAAAIAEQQTRNLEPVSKLDYEKRKEDRINNIYLNDALIRGRKTAPTNEDLGNYDVFGKYEPKYSKKEIKQRTGFLKSENKTITIIPASEVDVNDKKLIGEVPPVNDNGEKYYIVRDDGDWEGKNGQVISRANAARKNMDATSLNEVRRGRLSEGIVPKPTNNPLIKNNPSGITWK